MKKILRYLLIVALALLSILIFINIPKLVVAMLQTAAAVSWQDWMKYVIGIVIGSVATLFAVKGKKKTKNISEDNSKEEDF